MELLGSLEVPSIPNTGRQPAQCSVYHTFLTKQAHLRPAVLVLTCARPVRGPGRSRGKMRQVLSGLSGIASVSSFSVKVVAFRLTWATCCELFLLEARMHSQSSLWSADTKLPEGAP